MKSLRYLKKKKFWLTIGLDVLFVISLSVLSLPFQNLLYATGSISFSFYPLLYLLLVVLVYHFFKYHVWNVLFFPKRLKVNYLGFLWRSALFPLGVLLLFYFCYVVIVSLVLAGYQKWYVTGLVVLFAVLGYIFWNTLQVSVLRKKKITDWLSFSLRRLALFSGIVLGEVVLVGAIFWIVSSSFQASAGLNLLLQLFLLVFLPLLNAINRVCFYAVK